MQGLFKRRMIGAFGYSMKGLRACFVHEEAFRVEVVLATLLVPIALILGQSGVEQALLIAPVILVLIVELLNSAVEAAVDRISLEHAELSGRAKDLGSAAVFLAMMLVVIVWGLLLL